MFNCTISPKEDADVYFSCIIHYVENQMSFSLVILALLVALLIYICCMCLSLCLRYWRGKKPPQNYELLETQDQYDGICYVCLGEYLDDSLSKLPCSHTFHTACIDIWILKQTTTCPQCRRIAFASIPWMKEAREARAGQGSRKMRLSHLMVENEKTPLLLGWKPPA